MKSWEPNTENIWFQKAHTEAANDVPVSTSPKRSLAGGGSGKDSLLKTPSKTVSLEPHKHMAHYRCVTRLNDLIKALLEWSALFHPYIQKNTHPPTPEIFNESTNVRKTLIEDVMSFLVLIFFSSKILKFVHSQFWFFAAWLVISFKVECISVVKGRQMPLSPSKSVEVAQNLIDPISEKRNLTFRFPSGTKTFTFWSNFFKLN